MPGFRVHFAFKSIPETLLQQYRSEIVSDESEMLILVDSTDRETGILDKQSCHDATGVLHRAFSLFVFNNEGDLLVQQRADNKRLWPGYWSNSCCSHPRAGEDLGSAVRRRSHEELGIAVKVQFVYKFEYLAEFENLGTEHELCSVYIARFNGDPVINQSEIKAWRWCPADELDRLMDVQPELFTPWFQMEWTKLRTEFENTVTSLGAGASSL